MCCDGSYGCVSAGILRGRRPSRNLVCRQELDERSCLNGDVGRGVLGSYGPPGVNLQVALRA